MTLPFSKSIVRDTHIQTDPDNNICQQAMKTMRSIIQKDQLSKNTISRSRLYIKPIDTTSNTYHSTGDVSSIPSLCGTDSVTPYDNYPEKPTSIQSKQTSYVTKADKCCMTISFDEQRHLAKRYFDIIHKKILKYSKPCLSHIVAEWISILSGVPVTLCLQQSLPDDINNLMLKSWGRYRDQPVNMVRDIALHIQESIDILLYKIPEEYKKQIESLPQWKQYLYQLYLSLVESTLQTYNNTSLSIVAHQPANNTSNNMTEFSRCSLDTLVNYLYTIEFISNDIKGQKLGQSENMVEILRNHMKAGYRAWADSLIIYDARYYDVKMLYDQWLLSINTRTREWELKERLKGIKTRYDKYVSLIQKQQKDIRNYELGIIQGLNITFANQNSDLVFDEEAIKAFLKDIARMKIGTIKELRKALSCSENIVAQHMNNPSVMYMVNRISLYEKLVILNHYESYEYKNIQIDYIPASDHRHASLEASKLPIYYVKRARIYIKLDTLSLIQNLYPDGVYKKIYGSKDNTYPQYMWFLCRILPPVTDKANKTPDH